MFKSIEKNVSAEIIEKKSKFIANIYAVNSKKEAEDKLSEIKKKYHDAKHNCFAYIVENIEKCSDDGEPSGTAGAPLLDLIKINNFNNVLIIVTRYFGGILLGTGGLVRAYTEVAKKAFKLANVIEKEYGIRYSVEILYNNQKNLEYICKKIGINIIKLDYKENIIAKLESNIKQKELLNNSNIELLKEKIEEENIVITKK